ncbi:Alanine--tRNA ligase, partial [Cladochytrium tenue]
FKPVFLGTADPNSAMASWRRVTNTQKCIRAGGKHNDLEDVGRDVYHHTFFEMLGSWSFGDYFKKEAIVMAWELLTKVFKLPKDRLYITYFAGDESLGLVPDLEARQYWLDLGVDPKRVLPFGVRYNFWEMGDQGPCGVSSEISFDRVGGRDASNLVNGDDPDVVEIWNLVFMQYNREADGRLRALPSRHIDMGLGFERLVSVLQGVRSNYDTDVFCGILDEVRRLTGARAYTGRVGVDDTDGIDTAYRVVADHVRTLVVAISDGVVPGAEGQGYVLRRILRRGARYVRRRFNVPIGNFFSTLAPAVIESLGDIYPELRQNPDRLRSILDAEERGFAQTLDRGERQFEASATRARTSGNTQLTGADVWRLYDTYGFPVDLTRLMAAEIGLDINEVEFVEEQARARARSKSSSLVGPDGRGEVTLDVHELAELRDILGIPNTDDRHKYVSGVINATVMAIYVGSGFVSHIEGGSGDVSNSTGSGNGDGGGEVFGVILDRTNFYAEQGGQQHDVGVLRTAGGAVEFAVEGVRTAGGYVLHVGRLRPSLGARLAVGDEVVAAFDEDRRRALARHHTATHVLNLALRRVFGDSTAQRGSLVAPDRLRFDYSMLSAPTVEDITQVESICNATIAANLPVRFAEVPVADARTIRGLRVVEGEVYPNPVRVISIGPDVGELLVDPVSERWSDASIELCGGTHLSNTVDIESLAIVEETTVAKGVRRIVALTASDAEEV